MTPARIKHLAAQCADQLMAGEREWAGVIEAAIRGALDEVTSEEPSNEMWDGLARDIVFWHDMAGDKRTPASLFQFLRRLGREIPRWLYDEPELQNLYHAISKGTRAVIIYKAMCAEKRKDWAR